ncbi:MAG TPA: hypothetical protein VGN00_25905 [Puia sp.]|jgi:hypothetical protein
MKKSDKLLLAITIGFFALFGIANLTLYGLYKTGHVIRESDLFERSPVHKNMPTPRYLSVSHVNYIHMVASDHFAVEYNVEKLKPGKAELLEDLEPDRYSRLKTAPPPLSFSPKGDSMVISGSSMAMTIYFPSIPTILLDDATVDLKGSSHPGGPDCRLILKNCETIIGMADTLSYLGTLSLRPTKGTIRFDPATHLRDLDLSLDDSTSIDLLQCKAEKIHIQGAGNTNIIIIDGENIRKLQEGR